MNCIKYCAGIRQEKASYQRLSTTREWKEITYRIPLTRSREFSYPYHNHRRHEGIGRELGAASA